MEICRRFPVAAFVLFFWASAAAAEGKSAGITLPDILAVELPSGVSQIGPADSPLRELLSAAHSGSSTVTSDLQGKVGPGPIRVKWTAWDGPPRLGKVLAQRTARVIILPNGMAPAGVSGDENATAGNSAVHIARDFAGRVHMIWVDSGRPGARTGPVYRRASVDARGVVRFETEPVYVAENTPGDWNAYPALAVSGNTVQLVWQGGGTVRTRRLSFGPSGWTFSPILDTGAKSGGRDTGPLVIVPVTPPIASERAYALLSYRASKWFQPGIYYSVLFPDASVHSDGEHVQHDFATTLRFDVNEHWLVKLEGHYMLGSAGLSSALNDNLPLGSLRQAWGVLMAKTTAYF